MSERLGEEAGKAGPSCRTEEDDDDDTSESGDACSSRSMVSYHSPFESSQDLLAGQDSSMSENTAQQSFPTLKVKRPGRPRIHPPKPAGISKPRGRPRGSKNKKPRKRRDSTSLTERPPKRPRGRPRKWPPEMWEGFQRSQFAATQHMQQMQRQQQQQHSQEMLPGPSHLYYEDHMHSHHEDNQSAVPPPLSHLPYMVTQHETQELSQLMQMPPQPQMAIPQQQQPPPPHLHLHQTIHPLQRHQHEQQQLTQRQEEQMLLIRPLYMQEQERQLREHELMMSQEQQQRYYHLEGLHHPPHSTS